MILLFFGLAISAASIRLVHADILTIFIRADGSVEPDNAPINRTGNSEYVFTADIDASLVIERGNIIVDGASFFLRGPGITGSVGLNVTGRNNVTVRNLNIETFWHGIHMSNSSGCNILENHSSKNVYGIWVEDSSSSQIHENAINATGFDGISLYRSSDSTVSDNYLTWTTGFGIIIVSGSNNTIGGNDLKNTHEDSIELSHTSNNQVIHNTVFATFFYGIELATSDYNTVEENSVENGTSGVAAIRLYESTNNILRSNNVTNNGVGFEFSKSSGNTIIGNTIENSQAFGITFGYSSGNFLFHNNFVNNAQQVSSPGSTNTWDDGYPSGGNYWSDYNGSDTQSGSGQNINGSDGIGDTPYVISEGNQDRYPLMFPYVVPEFSPVAFVSALMLTAFLTVISRKRNRRQA